jgi:hypothetical protein
MPQRRNKTRITADSDVTVIIRVSKTLHKKISAAAKRDERTISNWGAVRFKEYFKNKKNKPNGGK